MFEVKAIQGNIRPGDDFKLRFGLSGSFAIAKAQNGDFIAVYDKKMLWRANLYIDEGDNDWNNLNPWDSLDNDWQFELPKNIDPGVFENIRNAINNRTERMQKALRNINNISSANDLTDTNYQNALSLLNANYIFSNNKYVLKTDANEDTKTKLWKIIWGAGLEEFNVSGGQSITPSSFTYNNDYISGGGEDNVEVYAMGCHDSPYEFNNEMWQQKQISGSVTPNNYDDYTKPNPSTGKNIHGSINYVNRNGINYFPFLPGWALYRHFALPHDTETPTNWENVISAGTDCVGLVQRSASYPDNNYFWNDVVKQELTNLNSWFDQGPHPLSFSQTINDITYPSFSWQISCKVSNGRPQRLNLVVPGDVMNIWYGTSRHVVIVQGVEYTNGRNTSMGHIRLIEATWAGDRTWAKVVKNVYTVKNYNNNHFVIDWWLVRLIQ